MRKLFEFIRSVYVVVLFVALEAIALNYYARSSHYTQARLLVRSAEIAGGVHGVFAGVRRYFTLGRENRMLAGRVAELEERLAAYGVAETAARLATYLDDPKARTYRMMAATVISSSVNRTQNQIILDRGRLDGVVERMAVLSLDGAMVGYVVDCTDRYSVAIPVLNTAYRASGRIAESDYIGSVYWDGADQHVALLGDVSKYADPQPGQRVVTTGFSQFFPPDVPIGTVESAELNETQTAYTVRVRLAAEIATMTEVLLVENRDRAEIESLRQSEKLKPNNSPE